MAFWDDRPPRKGEVIRALPVRRLAEEIRRLSRQDAAAPLRIGATAAGSSLDMTLGDVIFAKLSGAGSPYSWAEQVPGASGTWAAKVGGRSGTGNAHDRKGRAGLANKVVALRAEGTWFDFEFIKHGVVCNGTLRVTVNGCPLELDLSNSFLLQGPHGLPGATVTLSGGASLTGTTNSSGQVTFTNPGSGTLAVTVTVTHPRYNVAGSPFSASLPCTGANNTGALSAFPKAGFYCDYVDDSTTGPVTDCVGAYPGTLHLTDAHVTNLALSASTQTDGLGNTWGVNSWGNSYTVSLSGMQFVSLSGSCSAATVTATIIYRLYPPWRNPTFTNSAWELWQTWFYCTDGSAVTAAMQAGRISSATAVGAHAQSATRTAQGGTCGTPLAFSVTMPSDAAVPGTVTISE